MLDSLAEALAIIDKSKCVSPNIFLQTVKDSTRLVSASPTTGAVVTCIIPGKVKGLASHACLDKGTLTSAIQGRKGTLEIKDDSLMIIDKSYRARIPFTDAEAVPNLTRPEGNPTFVISAKNAKALLSLINKCGIERVHDSQPDPNVVINCSPKAMSLTTFDEMQLCSLKAKPLFEEPTKFLCPLPTLQTVLALPFQTARFWVADSGVTVATATWSICIPSLAEGVASGDTVTQKLKEVLAIKAQSSVEIPSGHVTQFLTNTSGIYQSGALYQFARNEKGLTVSIEGAKGESKAAISKTPGKPVTFGLHRSFLHFVLGHEPDKALLDLADGLVILRGEHITYVAALAQ